MELQGGAFWRKVCTDVQSRDGSSCQQSQAHLSQACLMPQRWGCTSCLSSSGTRDCYCETGGHANIFIAVGMQPTRIKKHSDMSACTMISALISDGSVLPEIVRFDVL